MNSRFNFNILATLAAGLLCAGCASEHKQAEFTSPYAAVDSLMQALRYNNTNQLHQIFGPDSDEILSSGDAIADRAEVTRFLAAYDRRHSLQDQYGNNMTLLVGEDDWPFPVPIVREKDAYVFDTAAGKDEILNRRIGRNELGTQQVCLAILDAQRDYVATKPMGGDLPLYARKIVSDSGKKNGLYWPIRPGETTSPLGEFVAQAAEEGYRKNTSPDAPPTAYHGYRYKLLTAQGSHAKGSALDYEVNGNLIGGFAVVACPAQYGNSGIMTFMTNHEGIIYQRDLGPETETLVQQMTTFDPSPEWTVVNPHQDQPTTAPLK